MSAIAQFATGHRPAPVTAAAALLALVVALTAAIVLAGFGGFDPAFLAIAGALATLKLVAAAGLWRCLRWAPRPRSRGATCERRDELVSAVIQS